MIDKLPKINLINLAAGLTILLFAIGFFYLFSEADAFKRVAEFLEKKIPSPLFVVLMFILPAIGFPVSIFLVLSGIKFSLATALVLMILSFPVHMLISFWIAHSFLRDRLISFLARHGYEPSRAPAGRPAWFTILFIGLPGIPYAPKNYILALSGTPLSYFMGLGLPMHLILGAPFVVLGASTVKANLLVSLGAVAAVGLGYLLFMRLKRVLAGL